MEENRNVKDRFFAVKVSKNFRRKMIELCYQKNLTLSKLIRIALTRYYKQEWVELQKEQEIQP